MQQLSRVEADPLQNSLQPSLNAGNNPLENIRPEPQKTQTSPYRHVFTDLRGEFKDFLQAIFYQLDDKKVFEMMDSILSDPDLSDEEIYQKVTERVGATKKWFAPFYTAFKALPVVRTGVAKQSVAQMEGFEKSEFKDYLELSTARYGKVIEKEGGFSFHAMTAVCNETVVTLLKRFEAGALFSSYPFTSTIDLNDKDCENFLEDTAKTYRPLTEEVKEHSQDVVGALGGLHHVPEDRLEEFTQSLGEVIKPGGVLLVRDHDAKDENIEALAFIVHSFVNAVDGFSAKAETAEVKNFQEESYWEGLLKRHGFSRIETETLVLPKDPTKNGVAAFVKLPQKAGEVEEAAKYVKGYQRSSIGSYATWIEWGNVRFEQQFAEFIQDHHAYQFDYIGHLRQHWSHFSNTLKESWNDPEASVKDVLFSDNTMMNLFILFGVTLQLSGSALAALPSVLMAKWRHGDEWKEVVNLSALEKFQAKMQLDYSEFILYDPFFKYDYFKAIGEMWSAIYHSDDSFLTKCGDVVSAIPATLALTVQGLPSLFINHVYYAGEGESDEETIHVIIEDPQNRLQEVIEAWDEKKMETTYNERHPFEKCAIKEVYEAEGTKLISMPYYKPFMEITQLFGEKGITFKTVGGQKKVTLDLLLEKEAEEIAGARAIYTLDHLQDESKKYVTAEVDVENLSTFCGQEGVKGNIAHIHCHR